MKNGKIELLRFLFCISVVLYHLQRDFHVDQEEFREFFSFFMHGRSGVEFFFIISGFFMAKHALKMQGSNTLPGNDTLIFLAGKIKRVYMPLIVVAVFTSCYIMAYESHPVISVIRKIPSLFFLQETGIWHPHFISVAWYLSAMLIGMAIIYPFLRINYDVTARAAAPIISILMMGFLMENFKALPNRPHFDIIDPGNLRAIAILLLGVTVFEMSGRLKEHHITEIFGWRATVMEFLCYAATFYYINSDLKLKYDGVVALILAAGVMITMSKEPSKLFNNKLMYFLGDISLSVFLSQNLMRNFMRRLFKDTDTEMKTRLILTFIAILCTGIAVHYISQGLTVLVSRWYGRLKKKYYMKKGEAAE